MINSELIRKATELLRANQLIGLPTETVYGLAGNALSETAIEKIYQLKERPATNPLIVHFSKFEAIKKYLAPLSTIQEKNLLALKKFWPGPLTIVLPKNNLIPNLATAGQESVAIRIPNHPVALKLLANLDFPLVAPSANKSNYISPTTAKHVEDEFAEQLELVLDGGSCQIGLESTVVSLLNDQVIILRPGAITLEDIQAVIPEVKIKNVSVVKEAPQESPGQQVKHYSPHTKLAFLSEYDSPLPKKSGLICFKKKNIQKDFQEVAVLSTECNYKEISEQLFAALREFDNLDLDLILIDSCPSEGLGVAIMDRLNRAVTKQ